MALQGIAALEIRLANIGNIFEQPDLQNAFQECREVVLEAFDENFETSSSPDAGPWPARQDNEAHPLLIKSGGLRKAATGKGPGHATVWMQDGFQVGVDTATQVPGSGIVAAARHNYGDSWMPQREFLAVPSSTETECREILVQRIREMLDDGR